MTEPNEPTPAQASMHELAEALQAMGNYLGVLRRGPGTRDGTPSQQEIVVRGHAQYARAARALHELRAVTNDEDRSSDKPG